MKPKYEVLTWDMDKQKFTPQEGVRRGPWTLFGLRKALRALRHCGYSCEYSSGGFSGSRYGDPSVLVQKL